MPTRKIHADQDIGHRESSEVTRPRRICCLKGHRGLTSGVPPERLKAKMAVWVVCDGSATEMPPPHLRREIDRLLGSEAETVKAPDAPTAQSCRPPRQQQGPSGAATKKTR